MFASFRLSGLASLVILAASSLFLSPAWAQTGQDRVFSVQVVGNQRIEAETIRSYMLIGAGDAFNTGRIDRSLKSLYSTGLFADVTIRREGTALVVRVVENPVINQLAFEGNNKILDEDLADEVKLKPRLVFTRSRVQSDVQRIVQLYRRSGRFAATVEPKVIQQASNRVDLVFEINEGEVTGIRKINFVGNKLFRDSKLRSAIESEEEIWYKFLSVTDTYDPDRLTFDRELLRRFYLARGYADFRVLSAVAELTPDRKDFFITFSVEEGDQYRFGNVDVVTELAALNVDILKEELEFESGDIFNAEQVEDAVQMLTDVVGRFGYAFVDIRPRTRRDRETKTIDVVFEINEGRKAYVERINIAGNVRTYDRVVRREMQLVEGDAFNSAKLRRSRERIKALGFFEEVEVQQRSGSGSDQTIIDVNVEERPTGELSIGFGFSSVDQFIGDFSIRERNLLGRGQDLRAAIGLSFRRQSFDISLTEPYFLGRELSAGVDVFLRRTDFTDFSAFQQRTAGFRLRTLFPLTELIRFGLNYELRNDRIQDIDANASRFITEQLGSNTTSSIGYVAVIDRRDDPADPSSGFLIRFGQDFAGFGGDVQFVRSGLNMDYYYPWDESWITHLGWEEGVIFGIGQDVRLINRFFLGGNNFRGFAAGGIGPRDSLTLDALGGTVFYVGTIEQSFPLGLPEELGILGRVFTDFGTLARADLTGGGFLDTGTVRVSAGFGISWKSPLGPVALDLGFPVIKEPFDDTEVLRFNFGTRF